MTHLPIRPAWNCQACDNPWPCVTARANLRREHCGHVAALAVLMSGQAVVAAPDLGDTITAGDLYRRFLGWVAAS